MTITVNVSEFAFVNVVDSCSVSNILTSTRLTQAALAAGCHFCVTKVVEYECLKKPRSKISKGDRLTQERMQEQRQNGQFQTVELDLLDLVEFSKSDERLSIGKGELSSMILAKKLNQAFMTDDRKARTVAIDFIGDRKKVQTSPHLVGWLVYKELFQDHDVTLVVEEHQDAGRPLSRFYREIANEGFRVRLMASKFNT